MEQKVQRDLIYSPSYPHCLKLLLLLTSCITVVCLLQPRSQHWYITLYQTSPGFILIFCAFYGFWQMCSDMHPPLRYIERQFHCPQNALCTTFSSLLPFPWISVNLDLSHSLDFSRMSCSWKPTIFSLVRPAFLLGTMHVGFPHLFLWLSSSFLVTAE